MLHVLGACALLATVVAGEVEGEDGGLCVGDCVGKWQQCGGMNFNGNNVIDGFKACCDEGFYCYSINKYYSQCRSPGTTPPDSGWTGPFICSPCGPESAEPGELIAPGCDYTYIGQYNLQDCADVCASQGWVGCDRYVAAGEDVAACYGYSEDSPGDCGVRNDNDNWISWLVCPNGAPTVAFTMSADAEAAHEAAPIAPGEVKPF